MASCSRATVSSSASTALRVLALLRHREPREGGLLIEPRDALHRRLEIEAQRALDRHLEEAELAVLEDADDDRSSVVPSIGTRLRLAVAEIAVNLRQSRNVGFGQFVALVVEALLHLLEEACAVDQLHLAAPLLRLAVGDEPDIGEDAGVVEQLIRQSDDRVEPVVLDDPTPDVGRAGPGVAAEQRRAVEDDGDL